jgi:hypothetical protein
MGNAILYVLLVRALSTFDWFVIPCIVLAGVAGVVLIRLWIGLLRGPDRWSVRPGEVTAIRSFLGFSWSRTFEVEWLDRIELRRTQSKSRSLAELPGRWPRDELPPEFALALVDLNERDVAVFQPVTKGEALWMAGIIAAVLKDAFPKDGEIFARWSVSADPHAAGSKALADRWLDEPVFS